MTALIIALVLIVLVLAALVYPGEFSHFGARTNQWLYDRAARNYQDKWQRPAYQKTQFDTLIAEFALHCCDETGTNRVLDLGCGTGRGIRIASASLPGDTRFTGIDYSGAMLDVFRAWLYDQDRALQSRVTLFESDLLKWLTSETDAEEFGAVLMLEVGEFLSDFAPVLRQVARRMHSGGGLVLTRPAGYWWLFFPGRRQSRKALSELLKSLDFDKPEFIPWRTRYELVFVRKNSSA